jgi:hypothetical protein
VTTIGVFGRSPFSLEHIVSARKVGHIPLSFCSRTKDLILLMLVENIYIMWSIFPKRKEENKIQWADLANEWASEALLCFAFSWLLVVGILLEKRTETPNLCSWLFIGLGMLRSLYYLINLGGVGGGCTHFLSYLRIRLLRSSDFLQAGLRSWPCPQDHLLFEQYN